MNLATSEHNAFCGFSVSNHKMLILFLPSSELPTFLKKKLIIQSFLISFLFLLVLRQEIRTFHGYSLPFGCWM